MTVQLARGGRLVTAAVAAALLLASCGGDSDTGSTNGGGGGDTTFVTGLASQPEMLVRSFTSDAITATVGLAIAEGLVRTTKDKEVVPALAQSWDISDDGLSYTFHLRQGVTWHDGEPFTSADVVFSFQEVLPLSPTGAVLTGTIDTVTAPDDATVVVTLKQPLAPLLLALGPQDFSIQPAHIYEGTDLLANPNNRAPVGTGPYVFDSWSGDTITLTANKDYWDGAPAIGRLVYKVIPDSNSRANALLNGEIDYINKFDVDDTIVKALDGNDEITLQNGRVSATFMTMWLNQNEEPLGDPEVRKALFMALDRDLMAQSADPEFTQPATGSFPIGLWATDTGIDYLDMYGYDSDAAAALLDEAGYPEQGDGTRFTVRLRYVATQPYTQALAAIIADNWRAIGVETEPTQDEATVNSSAVFTDHDFGTNILSLDTRPDPEFGIGRVYKCNPNDLAFNNPTGYCNEELDALFVEAARTQDQPQRAEIYAQAQAIIAEELPAITLLQMDQPDAIRSSFNGIEEFLSGALSGDLTWSALEP
ncbi:ABC transporter substrate-binding protein [Jiangella asiatica]|uniref:Solute-binding protein family 5 domain-containing protein n=1 Tax=Jiangella asiatica TaxID=2530372 RepID=A0A4R5D742_9ACTN|nr:ABC transporter substrate-binding protein [Jiangella asiatica]TDE09322.1 hypothetical protein E1269_15040 [Jiangella asiatica]